MAKRIISGSLLAALTAACGSVDSTDVGTSTEDIVGGVPVQIEEFPWQISLQYGQNAPSHICGGSVLDAEWVLTAQHCVAGTSPAELRVGAGTTAWRGAAANGQVSQVRQIVRFPGYRDAAAGNDVALLELETPLDLSGARVSPISLVTDESATVPGTLATVSGWGTVYAGGPSARNLRAADVPLVSAEVAQEAYSEEWPLGPDQIGAGDLEEGGVDSCQGDSGGPLVVPDGDGSLLAGVVSWGYGCGDPQYPGMYARVSWFADWIQARIAGTYGSLLEESGLQAADGDWVHYEVTVPAGATSLRAQLSGGAGDADLYVRRGSEATLNRYQCRSYDAGPVENCEVAMPSAGLWYVSVYAASSFEDVELEVASREADGDLGTSVYGPDYATVRAWTHYGPFEVTPGSRFVAALDAISQNPDLYVRFDAQPDASSYDCRPRLSGAPGDEVCDLIVPEGASEAYVSVAGRTTNAENRYLLTVKR